MTSHGNSMNDNSVHGSSLGQHTAYPTEYSPQVLFPIPRAEGRALIDAADVLGIYQGVDVWHVFELSWLDHSGKPQAAIGRITLPASTPYLVESKSLKLYFNSLNFCRFAHPDVLTNLVQKDISQAAGAEVQFELLSVDDLSTHLPMGIGLDGLSLSGPVPDEPDASLLALAQAPSEAIVEELLYSDLLRSNCPVTGQPDWGTVFIRYEGQKIDHQRLLTYIVSYRKHSGFHEQCVEQIFADLWQVLTPSKLAVHAQYTRRGGLDINPCRTSHPDWLPKVRRLARQ